MKKRLLVPVAISLVLAVSVVLGGCSMTQVKQTARTVGQIAKKTYYDTQTASSVQVGDISISYKVFGSGDPLVMITGYSTTKDTWQPLFLQALASKYKVVVFDNRGMGDTTAGTKPFTIDQFGDDTAGLIEALGFGKANVLGGPSAATSR